MTGSERVALARTLQKAAMAGIGRTAAKVAPSLLRGIGSNMGMGAKLGLGAAGAAGLYGAYRMIRPNTHGILGQAQQAHAQQSNDLNQVYDFANTRH